MRRPHPCTLVWCGMIIMLLVMTAGCTQQPGTGQLSGYRVKATSTPATLAAAEPTPTEATALAQSAPLTPTSEPSEPALVSDSLLQTVKERGELRCGINGKLPGFSYRQDDGTYTGLDADFCRVVATAIFGTPEAVSFHELNTLERFPALLDGEVDVLFSNTTWTFRRNNTMALDFGPVIFYDGQSLMTRRGIETPQQLDELEGATICVLSATTTESNVRDFFRVNDVEYDLFVFDDMENMFEAYDEGDCHVVTSDRSGLIARRQLLSNPEEHTIMGEVFSKEPLAPVVRQNDSQWRNVITWAVYATMQAEAFGITSENLNDYLTSERPAIRRFLGLEATFGEDLGLNNDFAVSVLQEVGNYAEIYHRNLGPDAMVPIERGDNSLWEDGGLLYVPPFQ